MEEFIMLFEEIREVICEQLEIESDEVTLDTTFERFIRLIPNCY